MKEIFSKNNILIFFIIVFGLFLLMGGAKSIKLYEGLENNVIVSGTPIETTIKYDF